MTIERERQILELLDEALERSPRERRAFLDDSCGDDGPLRQEVEALLDTEVGGGLLAEPAFSVHADDAGVGRRIGPYQLIRLIDRGGMGSVYLAQREDFEQRVALKLIRRGLDADDLLVRRFENERQILARLEHPHIAHLLDGGTTADRLPYFVMEYVEGEPIDRYCQTRGLPVGERLELFRRVCSTVQFAHQNLVIHRDLKPSNILITADGHPRLLDFGIAKLLDDSVAASAVETELGQGPMTPRYASPEQIRLEPVTTASDVYSLGVLLYELLTGLDPYGVAGGRSDEIARAVCETEPDRPSTAVRRRSVEPEAVETRRLRRELSGDLDSIVLQAMRKEPEERYASAEQMSEDIRRHLEGLPVGAQTGTFTYRAGKFVRRHRLAMAVVAAFLVLIVGFSIFSTILWQRAERDRQRAVTVLEILETFTKAADPDETGGRNLTAAEALQRGKEEALQKLASEEPELQIYVGGELGEIFRKLGAHDDSKEMMEASLEAARLHYGGDHSEVAKRLSNLAVLLNDHQDHSEAERLLREALEMRLRLRQPESKLVRTKSNLAATLMLQGVLGEAEELYKDVLETRLEMASGPDDKDVATSRRNLGAVYLAQGKPEQAEPQLRQALETRRRRFDPGHTKVASVLDLLGTVLAAQDQPREAESLYSEALSIRRHRLGEKHLAVANTKKNLAALLAPRDPDTARVFVGQALETFYRTRPGGWEVADAESVLGTLLADSGLFEEAEPCLVESHARLAKLLGARTFQTRRARGRLVDFYQTWDKPKKFAQYQEIADSASEVSATSGHQDE